MSNDAVENYLEAKDKQFVLIKNRVYSIIYYHDRSYPLYPIKMTKPRFYYADLDNYNEDFLKEIILWQKEEIERLREQEEVGVWKKKKLDRL